MELEEKVTATDVVFQGKYLRTEVQTVLLPDGQQATREIVSPPDAVAVLAVEKDTAGNRKVHLVRQYRTAIRKTTLEIPAGIIEAGEDPLETADRECREEIGMAPQRLEPLCSFYHSVGFSTGRIQIVLADKLKPLAKPQPDPHELLEAVTLDLNVFYEKIFRGEIFDSKSIVAALWYRHMRSDGQPPE